MQVWAEPDAFVPKARWAKHCSPSALGSIVGVKLPHGHQVLQEGPHVCGTSRSSNKTSASVSALSALTFLHLWNRSWQDSSFGMATLFMKALEGEILYLHFQQRYFCWLLPYHYSGILMSIFKEISKSTHAFLQKRCGSRIWPSWPHKAHPAVPEQEEKGCAQGWAAGCTRKVQHWLQAESQVELPKGSEHHPHVQVPAQFPF